MPRTIVVWDECSKKYIDVPYSTGNKFIYDIFGTVGSLNYLTITCVVFKDINRDFICFMRGTNFENCTFDNCDLTNIHFNGCKMIGCKFKNCQNLAWLEKAGLEVDNLKPKEKTVILTPTNKEIEETYHCKVYSLPNKSYVKIKWTCDFCHRDWYNIYRRDNVESPLMAVPNCDKKVCKDCHALYRISEKFEGNRVYGYHGTVHKYTTPLDANNTVIIGVEMEFEGDFYGWKELQDAHQGMLHYGYDSSVIGQNELSWDCGSYSWWKYLAPLKNVCEVLSKYGGRAGDSAGIHIHVSRPDVYMNDITQKINNFGRTFEGKALFESVSLRNNKEKFERYSNLNEAETSHHAGISYNSYDTCEFRLFNSTLDYKLILSHIKFCKEVFNAFANKKDIWKGFSKETIKHITECAKIQMEKGFITEEQFNLINKKLG